MPVGVPSAVGFEVSLIDRYAIRTRNLQDWNLTRYRCANRSSKVSAREDAAAVRLEEQGAGERCQRSGVASLLLQCRSVGVKDTLYTTSFTR